MEILNELLRFAGSVDIGTGVTVAGLGSIKKDSLVGVVYEDIAQPTLRKFGVAIGDIAEAALTPTLLFRLGNDIIKLRYANYLKKYTEKLNGVADVDILEVNPQIGIPILENLSLISDESIAELFINLLFKASSRNTVNEAHPAFVKILERLSVDEAIIIDSLKHKNSIPYVCFTGWGKPHLDTPDMILEKGFEYEFDSKINYPKNVVTYIDNLQSQGIITKSEITAPHNYEQLAEKFDYTLILEEYKQYGENAHVFLNEYSYSVTAFGRQFIKACTVNN